MLKKLLSWQTKRLMKHGNIQKLVPMKVKILAEMQRVVFEGGGDYPANEYIIGSGHNALVV